MGMVLPEGVLNNKNLQTVREYFEEMCIRDSSDTAQAARILERTFHESHFSIQDDHNLRLHNPVSYTHLDVYKRQPLQALPQAACPRRDFISGFC